MEPYKPASYCRNGYGFNQDSPRQLSEAISWSLQHGILNGDSLGKSSMQKQLYLWFAHRLRIDSETGSPSKIRICIWSCLESMIEVQRKARWHFGLLQSVVRDMYSSQTEIHPTHLSRPELCNLQQISYQRNSDIYFKNNNKQTKNIKCTNRGKQIISLMEFTFQ